MHKLVKFATNLHKVPEFQIFHSNLEENVLRDSEHGLASFMTKLHKFAFF
jgi:hypothetical protein